MSQWILATALFAALACAMSGERALRVVEPKESDALLANPGMGWQTFHTFADEDRNLQGLPSASAYFRFYWRQIEPVDGHPDFALFDRLLAHGHRAGQKVAFRIMCTGSSEYMDVPKWLKDQGCRGVEYTYRGSDKRHWVPDFTDPLFRKAHFRLIRELGRRYNGHPDLDVVDIGSVGLWGEWHMSGTRVESHEANAQRLTPNAKPGEPVPMPPEATLLEIIDAWRTAFSKTPVVMQLDYVPGMIHAREEGCGWRADCLGDMGGFSKTWYHMRDAYPPAVEKTGSAEVWRRAPVAFESCWDMRKWKEEGWDIPYIFDYALRYHTSYMNNKSAPIPAGTRPEVERFLRKLGYRLVLRRLEHDAAVAPGGELRLNMAWENVGVAPPYSDYRLAVRLRRLDRSRQPLVLASGTSVQGWLPGRKDVLESLRPPARLAQGRYALDLGIVDPRTRVPAVKLAIQTPPDDGWYPLSEVEVRG